MLICFICIWVGCIKGISGKILFNPISFFFFLILIYINNYSLYKKCLYAPINVVICSVRYMFHNIPKYTVFIVIQLLHLKATEQTCPPMSNW